MASLKEHQEVLFEMLQEFDRVCKKNQIPYTLFAGTALGAVRHKGFIPWDDDLDVAMLRCDYERFMQVAPSDLSNQYYLQSEFSEHWPMHFSKLRKNNTTCLEKYHPKDKKVHQGIYIDIFPIDNASNNPLMRRMQFACSKVVFAKSFYKRGYETDSIIKKMFLQFCRILPLKPFYKITKMEKANGSEFLHSFFGGTSTFRKGIYLRKWMTETVMTEFEGKLFPISAHYHDMLTTIYGNYMELPKESERKSKKHALLVDTNKNFTEYESYRDGMKFDVYTRGKR